MSVSRQVKSLQDKFTGKKIFLIGNGPSLKYEQLEAIRGNYSLGLNNIAASYEHVEWRPTFYLNVTRSAMLNEHWYKMCYRGILNSKVAFLWHRNLQIAWKRPKGEPVHNTQIVPIGCHVYPIYSYDVDETVSRFGSAMFAAIQMADYMGFSAIYLLGCDAAWEPRMQDQPDPNHFSQDYWGSKLVFSKGKIAFDTHNTRLSHKIAAGSCRVQIYNCTGGGALDMYPRMTLEGALQDETANLSNDTGSPVVNSFAR